MKLPNKTSLIKKSLPPEFSSEEARGILTPFYKAPNKVLEEMVASGQIIRLKKGLFAVASHFEPFAAAGRIHSPSYLSFETALGFYGMLPERVNAIMSVVDARQLKTQAGGYLYVYRSQDRKLFSQGMTATTINQRNVLIATPEKALLDTIAWNGLNTKTIKSAAVFDYFCASYRLGDDELFGLSHKQLKVLSSMYRSRAPGMFVEELVQRKKQRHLL